MLTTLAFALTLAQPATATATTSKPRPGDPRLSPPELTSITSAPPTGPAPAQRTAPEVTSAAPEAQGPRYGWQIAIVDAASTLMLAGLFASDSSEATAGIALSSLSLSALGSAGVHFYHGQYGRGAASFGMRIGRVGAMTLGAFLASRACGDGDDFGVCGFGMAAVGGVVGYALVTVPIVLFDYIWARDDPEPAATAGLQWAPTFATDGEQTTFGLGARF